MTAQSFPKIAVECLLIAVLTCSAHAQEGQAPQGGQTTPSPQPTPRPDRPPIFQPSPQPTQPANETLVIRGRIISGPQSLNTSIVEVRFESEGGQPLGFAYADSSGDFTLRQTGVNVDQTMYVVVKLEGFKLYRERILNTMGRGGFEFLNIFLEREDAVVTARGGAPVVDLRQLRAKIPGKAVDEYEKALKESSKGNRSKAVEGLQRAIKLAPDFYEAQHSLGVQYIALEKYGEAETALTKARDLSPKAADPLINLGTLYYQRGQAHIDAGRADEAAETFEKAEGFLEEAIRRDPLNASAHGYLGAAQYKLGSFDLAETTLTRALELDLDQNNARLMMINVYTKSARYDKALEQIAIFLTRNPKGPQRPALEGIKQQIEKALAK